MLELTPGPNIKIAVPRMNTIESMYMMRIATFH
jgi:hypothetical protein